ncbi:hypothetical protein CC80DRAFT_598473 [Byssothecium circinans]|uniref:RNA-dependent RNA polymerase n=1 Tax=Byssothecium circinans TaxID=147558 RepID=A0A6A5TCP1_9PLEO|nr:hypothetical protein CC80DRAFT_598473 [Byssothecium circinans]
MHGNGRFQPGNRGQSAGPPAPQAPAPDTPRKKKDGAGLNSLIRSLESEWQLGLQVRDNTWSPSKSSDSLHEKVNSHLKRLYYCAGPELENALAAFRVIAPALGPKERLNLLHSALKSQNTTSPLARSRTGTPVGSEKERGAPPKVSKLQFFSTPKDHQISTTSGHSQNPRSHDSVPDPGSPTDDDEEYVTPKSPTLSSRSANRRVQASSRFPLGSTSRKRLSDSSFDATGSSPKLTKTSKGKQPSDRTSPSFKQPSLEMLRSFQAGASSMKSSFVSSSFNTMSSSQQTQVDTAVTSFTSDAHDGDIQYQKLTRTSSTTMGSLDDQDLLHVSAKIEKEIQSRNFPPKSSQNHLRFSQSSQDMSRESTSTYGSVDEDDLLQTSFRVENELTVPPPGPLQLLRSPVPPTLPPAQGLRPDRGASPTKRNSDGTNPGFTPNMPVAAGHFTPVKAIGQPPRESSNDSPSRMPWYIRVIPDQNLFVDELSHELRSFPYFVLFICCRLANEHNVSMRELMSSMDPKLVHDPVEFWEMIKCQVQDTFVLHDSYKVWSSIRREFEGFTFKGRVTFRSTGHVFGLQLQPIEADRSCRFQRKFGSHRFLYLTLPSFETDKPARFIALEMDHIQKQFKTWFHKEHSFLGRKWRAFHIEPIKGKKRGKAKDDNADKRMVMFATEGYDIDTISVGEMLNWFFPCKGNMRQNFCKAYARIDLGLSRTIPTLVFRPSQIRYVKDIKADDTPEQTEFDDPQFDWDEPCPKEAVMNDGCSRMSVGAALKIWQLYKKATNSKEPIPSVFQGRIGGAKGMWMACGEPSTNDPTELEIWIEIADSQLKFEPHDEDLLDGNLCDPHRLTFECVGHSSSPGLSELHISFIPILVDRGVPQQDIADLMSERLKVEREDLLSRLSDPVKVYHWLHQQSSADEDPPFQASLPQSLPNKIRFLLQSGLYPTNEPYLATVLCRYIKTKQLWMEQKLKVPMGKATFLYGVADLWGVLNPGEIHLGFSSPFVDEITGATYRALNNMDVLVARQPACRRSDIQKVRAVKKPELSHLPDVVVFPSRGKYPMAGKLQGGDYDGDTFWLCWDPILVSPFKNAPAPLQALDEGKYGIKKDTRKLFEIMDPEDLSTVDNLLKEVLDFRMAPSLLGMVTNFLEKQAYKENQIYSKTLDALCDMHDLLVDAPKQGYLFSKADWTHFVRNTLRCGNPKVPTYKQAMEDCENSKELGDADKIREKKYKYKRENVLDYLYFEIVRTHDVATLKAVQEALPKQISDDPVLQSPYLRLRDHGSAVMKAELTSLVAAIRAIERQWTTSLVAPKELKADQYNKTLNKCFANFRALLPSAATDTDVAPLLNPYLRPEFQIWEYIRASALYTELPKRHAFVWHMAGRELVALKCPTVPGAVSVAGNIFANMKPKPIRVPRSEYDDEIDEEEEEVGVVGGVESEDEFSSAKETLSVSVGESPGVGSEATKG